MSTWRSYSSQPKPGKAAAVFSIVSLDLIGCCCRV